MKLSTFVIAASLAFGTAGFAGGHDQGKDDAVKPQATENGTLHPGHVAVFASGKYNKPAEDFHLDGTPYQTGPGGYATTRGKRGD